FADGPSREAIESQVDFSAEKVVVVSWWGSSSSSVRVNLVMDGKAVEFSIVTNNPALANLRPHVHVFAVPRELTVTAAKPWDFNLTEVSLRGVRVDFCKVSDRPKPLEIKSADELARAGVFADEASREAIGKRVDFSKDKLVVFVWRGSGQDMLWGTL